MSSSSFIEPSVELSSLAVDQLNLNDQAEKPSEGPAPQEKCSNDFDGYAEFVNYVAQHRIPIFTNHVVLLRDATVSVIGQGGTYVVRTAKLAAPLHSRASRPFLLKASPEALALGEAIESLSVEEGTNVVTKHIDFRNLKQRRAQGRFPASKFLKPFQTEVTILSHPFIREHTAFPSLLGIGLEISPDDVGEMPQLYPYLIMELGRQGSLEQSLRELWYRILEPLPRPPSHYDLSGTYRQVVLSWGWKMSLVHSICTALCALHHCGVVHGDIKLSNTLALIQETGYSRIDHGRTLLFTSEHRLAQLADFGSSILLSEIPAGAKTRLRSHTPPWNAPESTSEILREDLVKTDVYSYGLLFGRVMLQGASPFASTVDLANFLDSSVPEYDFVDIQRLRDADKIDDHIYKKIRETGFYSDEELQVIKTVLEKTLRTKIKDRIGTLMPIGEFLVRCATCSPEEAAASVEWEQTIRMRAISPGDGIQYDVPMQNPREESFIETPINVPNILDPIFADLRYERILLREVLEDLKQQIARNSPDDRRMAPVHYQISLCYFNGWGTPMDTEQFQDHLLKALDLGSRDALCLCHPVIGSPAASHHYPMVQVEADPDLFHNMLTRFRGNIDMRKAIQLQDISPKLFQMALSKARTKYFEYSDGKRLEVTGLLPMFMEQVVSSQPDLRNPVMGFDDLPEAHQDQQEYADTPFVALCLAASQGNMDDILKLINHLQDTSPFTVQEYLNRSTKSVTMDFSILEFDPQTQSASDLDGPIPGLSFKMEEHTHPLMLACSNGHSGIVLVLLAEGADPNQVDISGRSPLHYLARFDPDQVEKMGDLLLDGQPDTLINKIDNDGLSPLAFVLDTERNGVPDAGAAAARFLLRRGAAWYNTAKQESMLLSPFVKAVLSFNLEAMNMVKEFIQSSINERPTEDDGTRQLDGDHEEHETAGLRKGEYSCISVDESSSSAIDKTGGVVAVEPTIFLNQILYAIIALAREPNSVLYEKESTYGTTLAGVMQFLINSLDPKFTTAAITPVVRKIVKLGAVRVTKALAAALPSFDWSSPGMNMLVNSIELTARNFPDMLTTLAELGYNFNQVWTRDFQGYQLGDTFFHWAGYYRTPVALVKDICRDLHIDHKSTESDWLPSPIRFDAFDMAVVHGSFKLADYLIDQGADFNSPHLHGIKSRDASSPPLSILGYVLTSVGPEVQNTPRRSEIIRYLLRLNPDPLVCPDLKQNVFHLVWAGWGYIRNDCKSPCGLAWSRIPHFSLFQLCSHAGTIDFHPETEPEGPFDEVMAVFEQLRAHFTDPRLLTARDVNGATPLHFAASSGNIRGVQRLLMLHVPPNPKDNKGMSPIMYAVRAVYRAINVTDSGDTMPVEIEPREVMGPIMDLIYENWWEPYVQHIDRTVVLNRVLGSIRKRRQVEGDSGEAKFITRREEPTEILILVEIAAYLVSSCRATGQEDEGDMYYLYSFHIPSEQVRQSLGLRLIRSEGVHFLEEDDTYNAD